MDLTNLRDSLDVSSRERHPASTSAKKSELRLTRDFKSAAMQLTTLYRTSLSSAKRSYASGYAQSLQDILDVVLLRLQQSPSSAPGYPSHLQQRHLHRGAESNREELMWLVRYLRARIEAIKAESEDEEDRESEDEIEENQQCASATPSTSKMSHDQSAPLNTASSALIEPDLNPDKQAGVKVKDPALVQLEGRAIDERVTSNIVSSVITPSPTVFSFTSPSQSASIAARNTAQGTVRRKIKGAAATNGSINMTTTTVPHHHSAAASVSSEEENTTTVQQPNTPSKRASGRLGKRTTGRDKAGAFINTKRRRGMGEDRRDGGLH